MIQELKRIIGITFNKHNFKKIGEILEYTIKLWLLTYIIPLSFTLFGCIFLILGLLSPSIFLVKIYNVWVDFFTGQFLNIDAWRIHLAILFVCFIFVSLNQKNES